VRLRTRTTPWTGQGAGAARPLRTPDCVTGERHSGSAFNAPAWRATSSAFLLPLPGDRTIVARTTISPHSAGSPLAQRPCPHPTALMLEKLRLALHAVSVEPLSPTGGIRKVATDSITHCLAGLGCAECWRRGLQLQETTVGGVEEKGRLRVSCRTSSKRSPWSTRSPASRCAG